jgi:hypothetical protein
MECPVPRKLWEHPDPKSTQTWKFKTSFEQLTGQKFEDYTELYDYSCSERAKFWSHCFEKFPLVYSTITSYDPRKPCVDETPRCFRHPSGSMSSILTSLRMFYIRAGLERKMMRLPSRKSDREAI